MIDNLMEDSNFISYKYSSSKFSKKIQQWQIFFQIIAFGSTNSEILCLHAVADVQGTPPPPLHNSILTYSYFERKLCANKRDFNPTLPKIPKNKIFDPFNNDCGKNKNDCGASLLKQNF